MQNSFDDLEKLLKYVFIDKGLLKLALTHPSFANENKIGKNKTNQRLEFLGDAVLELVSSDFLYNLYSDYSEGQLTKERAMLVCEESLANIARALKLYEYLLIGKGENKESLKNNDSVMCDTLESVIGAIYLDRGLEAANKFINEFVLTDENLNKSSHDYKSKLQEIANSRNIKIEYKVTNESGPDHDKLFEVTIYYDNSIYGKGLGKSKKEAEQNAAKVAIDKV